MRLAVDIAPSGAFEDALTNAWWAHFTWWSIAVSVGVVVVALGAVAMARAELRSVRAAISPTLEENLNRLKRLPLEERREAFSALAMPAPFEVELAEALRASSPSMQLGAMNEALVDLDAALSARAHWGTSAVRLLALMGALGCVTSVIRLEIAAAAFVLVVTGFGVLATSRMSSASRQLEKSHRKLADGLVDLLSPGLPERRRRKRDDW